MHIIYMYVHNIILYIYTIESLLLQRLLVFICDYYWIIALIIVYNIVHYYWIIISIKRKKNTNYWLRATRNRSK